MDGRPDKGQHGGEKSREDDPIQHDPELSRVFGERDAQEAHNPVDCQVGNGSCLDDPEWGALIRVISQQVVMDAIHSQFSGCQPGLS